VWARFDDPNLVGWGWGGDDADGPVWVWWIGHQKDQNRGEGRRKCRGEDRGASRRDGYQCPYYYNVQLVITGVTVTMSGAFCGAAESPTVKFFWRRLRGCPRLSRYGDQISQWFDARIDRFLHPLSAYDLTYRAMYGLMRRGCGVS